MRSLLRLLVALIVAALLAGCSSARDDAPWQPVPTRPRPTFPTPATPLLEENLRAPFHVSAGCSRSLVFDFVDAPFGLLFTFALGFMALHRRRARAEAAFDPGAPLVDGPAVIFGVVELDPGDTEPAVEVRIHQIGKEEIHKGNWSHTWKEVRREVRARPFYVRRDDGTRVRVEPPPRRIALQDALSRKVAAGHAERVRIAELTAGERVYVVGALRTAGRAAQQSIYRGNAGGSVLVAPPFGTMVICTEKPGATATERARFHRGWAIALATLFALINLLVLPTYRVLTLDGEPVLARAVETQTWQEWVKPKNSPGYWVRHWAVRAERPGGHDAGLFEDECGSALHHDLSTESWTHAPFVASAHAPWFHQIGVEPKITENRVIILVLTTLILLFSYPISAYTSRPWYARRRVNEGGSGGLAASMKMP